MNETLYLVVTAINELVPQSIIQNMAMLIFVVTCCCVALIEVSIAMFIGNVASLINRILPEAPKVSNQVEASNKSEWYKKLVFWKKTS